MPLLFDSHAHLQDAEFADDLTDLLPQLAEQGVGKVILPGSSLTDSGRAAQVALAHPGLYCALGVHPHEASDWDDAAGAELTRLADQICEAGRQQGRDRVLVAVGEIGLDYHYNLSPPEIQKSVYYQQLELAHRLGLPVIIHEREAFADSYAILQRARAEGLLQQSFVCHCFSGGVKEAQMLLDLGGYLGFDGPITFKKSGAAPQVLRAIPADRYLLETDSPYLSPEPCRGRRNDPGKLTYIAKKAAEIRRVDYATILEESWQNACRLFQIDPSGDRAILQSGNI